MLILHLQIDDEGRGVFRGEAPSATGDASVPVRTTELLRVVRGVVWYPEGFDDAGGGALVPSMPNLLMFLSDVRGRAFKEGVFLADDLLAAAELFRSAARAVASGRYLPTLVEENGAFFARWMPLDASGDGGARARFFARVVDGLARRAGRSALEGERERHETVHDAWLAALRGDTGVLRWPDAEDARELMRHLADWRASLAVSAADRAALRFALEPPPAQDGAWRLTLAAAPTTRLGYVALGQAAAVFPPLGRLHGTTAELDLFAAESFLRSGAQALAAAGYSVKMPEGVMGEHVSAEAELTPVAEQAPEDAARASAVTKLTIRVAGEAVTENEIRFLLDQGSSLVFFRDRWIEVDRNILREALRALQSVKGRKLPVHDAIALACGLRRAGNLRVERVKAHGWLRGLLNELRGDETFRVLPQPKGFRGELRDYQLRGASWLAFLAKWGFGACLADDMGLGKTAQTIAFLLHRADARPALVVAPVSVTTNWVREFAKFAPRLKVYLHQGGDRMIGGSFGRACRAANVVVTGYSLLVRDFRLFTEVEFSALILDEAQAVKNPDTRVSHAVRALDAPVRIALTGTPLENSANDLWSLEEFLNPGLLGDRKEFAEAYTRPIREDAHTPAAAKLKHVLEPFMLRRLKTDPGVAAELGDKRETREWCTLDARQRARYEEALAAFRADAAACADDSRRRRGRILALLAELKEICDAPELLSLDAGGGSAPPSLPTGGKIARLDELLESIFDAGESCLVFTQYAKMGRLLRAHLLEKFGRRFPFLHGGLAPVAREAEIAAFNADPEPNAFILSLKAGGFGLNLTRATHVIHFDRWWNPAVENQATDRAHRIGQTKPVFVHLFICAGTLEEHVDELLESKRRLAGEIVGGGESFLLKMADGDLERMVSLS